MSTAGWFPSRFLPLAVLLLIIGGAYSQPKVDPDSGRIRMLMIGETGSRNQEATYFLLSDPMVDLTIIPAGDVADVETSKRFVRIYLPRTRDKLVSSFDVIELFDFVPHVLTDLHIKWMHDAVRDFGLGFALVEMSWYAVSDWTGNDAGAWMATILYDAYPCDMVIGKQNANTYYMDIVLNDPLVDIPGLDKVEITGVGAHGIQKAREGSKVFTVWRIKKEDAIVGGEFGSGTTLMIPMGWDNVPDKTEAAWDYYIDFVLNHAYYVARVPLPEDLNLARSIRLAFNEYLTRRAIAASLIEFIGRFGANTVSIEEIIAELGEEKERAQQLYIEGDFESSWDVLKDVLEGFQALSEESMKLKERAFFWIYLVEWLAVTGTLLVCGMALWSLMVRRRLYRQVEVTRTRSPR
ncbi:MAG: hypothetical protein HXS50_01570 [Theionarchaea archaeon]|nr:hypothetical protein [Theionarchaea archaeon]